MNAAIFDMDGTLVDSDELAALSSEFGLRSYYSSRGLDPIIPSRAMRRSLVGLPSLEYFAGLLTADRRGDATEIRTLVAGEEVRRLAAGEGRLFPGVRETLAGLRVRGWKIGLVSNCGSIYFDANLKHLGLREMVDVAFCLDHFPTKTDNVREAMRALGARSGVMVGDRAADLEAGRANGLRTIGCMYGYGGADELAHADAHISVVTELPSRIA
jgi:phosphoglycolate phosphatase